jgi:hypothetical protein
MGLQKSKRKNKKLSLLRRIVPLSLENKGQVNFILFRVCQENWEYSLIKKSKP